MEPNNAVNYVYRSLERDKTLHERMVGNSEKTLVDFDRATEKVLREFETLMQRNPSHALGHQGVAWTFSTCEDSRFHDSGRALREATLACELTRWNDVDCIDTLAAARANSGDFPEAVKWEDRAINFLQDSKIPDQDLLTRFEVRRALYLSRHLYLD